jgi:hypothetical protein
VQRFRKAKVGSSNLSAGTSLRSLRKLRLGKPVQASRSEASEGCRAEAPLGAKAGENQASYIIALFVHSAGRRFGKAERQDHSL